MKSAIETLEKQLRDLNFHLKTWGQPPNFSQRILDKINIEIKEHKKALLILKSKNE